MTKAMIIKAISQLTYIMGAILQWVTSCDMVADESTMNMLKYRKSNYLGSAYYIHKNKLIEY